MITVQIVSFVALYISISLILNFLNVGGTISLILSLPLALLYKKFHPKFIFKRTITLCILISLFFLFSIIINPIISIIIVGMFYISILIDRTNSNFKQQEKEYTHNVKNKQIEYKNIIISNKSSKIISISREVPFPEERLKNLKKLLEQYKSTCEERSLFTKTFQGYDMSKFNSNSLKNFFDKQDMFIPLKYKEPIDSKAILDEIETILNMKYSYQQLSTEETKLMLNWIFAVDCDKPLTDDDSSAVFDITNEHLYAYKLAENNTISEYNYTMAKKLNPNLTSYIDKLGNQVDFIDYQ